MNGIRFLVDVHIPEYLADEVIRLEPTIELLQIGNEGMPKRDIKDPELLIFS